MKNQNAHDFWKEFPRAAEAIIKEHYVDDYLDSFRTTEEAIDVVNEVKMVHSKGGITLRHFLSHKLEVFRGIEEIAQEECKDLSLEQGEHSESVLGLPIEDVFTYSVVMREDIRHILESRHIPTKREVVKVVMTLFNPLGLISFFLVYGKILIQDIWARETDWDAVICIIDGSNGRP